jgi:hypothetical protein
MLMNKVEVAVADKGCRREDDEQPPESKMRQGFAVLVAEVG